MRFGWIMPVLVILGCDGPAGPSVPTQPPSQALDSAIPADLDYSILSEHSTLNIKRSLDVRLSRKVPMATLRALAIRLRDADPTHYKRTFICYYLPGMKIGPGGWATSHFNPELEARIMGLSVAESEQDYTQPTLFDRVERLSPPPPDGPPPVEDSNAQAIPAESPIRDQESLAERAHRERQREIARRHAVAAKRHADASRRMPSRHP